MAKHRRPVVDLREHFAPILTKICRRVKLSEHGCWEWQGHKNRLGYGETSWSGKVYMLTRLVYAAVHGAFDANLDICHTCDNPGCCNPQHLWAGEHRENLLDGSRKKRLQGQWKTECLRGHPLSGDNLYLHPKTGFRACKACCNLRQRGYWRDGKTQERQRRNRAARRERMRLSASSGTNS